MSTLSWDAPVDRTYETGVNHGVLYPLGQPGVAWSGLTTITESRSGAEANAQYGDNAKYLNLVSEEQMGGTIEAFSYPQEFEQCDGVGTPTFGVYVGQQSRIPFDLSYRTLIGDSVKGLDRGYKIHLIYNSYAAPTEKAYATVNDSPEAVSFSWEFTSTPVAVGGNYKPTAHISIDSTKINPSLLATIEGILYGTNHNLNAPRMIYPAELIGMFIGGKELRYNNALDLYDLYDNGVSDLVLTTTEGEFAIGSSSRLSGDSQAGFYVLNT